MSMFKEEMKQDGHGRPAGKDAHLPLESGLPAILAVGAVCLIGVYLRLHLLRDQVLMDDEWHSMAFIIGRPFSWILTHCSVPSGFTSIPLNVYDWLLLKSVGWSEAWLHGPSVVFGLLCVCLGPMLARRIVGVRTAVTLSLLIAVSPILVFYARLSRPYSAVACLGFLSLLAAARWMKFGTLRDGVVFAVCGVFAVYWHPFAAVTVGTIGASVWMASIWRHVRARPGAPAPSWGHTTLVLGGMGVAGAILMLPALLDATRNSMADVARQGTIHLSSWLRIASLFAGTANPVMGILFWSLLVVGVVYLWKRNRWLAGTLVVCFPVQICALMLVRPHSCHVGIVLARYSIILAPASLMLVACGLQSIVGALRERNRMTPILGWVLVCAFVTALVLAGPLPRILGAPNNFTNHGIFQHNFGKIDWSRSFSSEFAPPGFPMRTEIRTDELSGFYRLLRETRNKRPIVEYPMMIGDHLNPHYFYQWYHQRPVIIGYTVGMSTPAPLKGGGVYGNTYVDEVLNLVGNDSKLRFHNLVNMTDYAGMKMRDVEFVIFHKRFEADISRLAHPPQDFSTLLDTYRREWRRAHEDEHIVAFSVDTKPPVVGEHVVRATNRLERIL